MATMQVEVVSAEKQLFSGEAKELYARALDGEIGIMPGHQPAVIALVRDGRCLLDCRTLGDEDLEEVAAAVRRCR